MNQLSWHQMIGNNKPTIKYVIFGELSGISSLIVNYLIYYIRSGLIDPNQELKMSYFFFAAVIGVACVIFGWMLGILMTPVVNSQGKLAIVMIFLMPLAFGVLGNLVIQSIIYPILIYLY